MLVVTLPVSLRVGEAVPAHGPAWLLGPVAGAMPAPAAEPMLAVPAILG